jgi:hypothetical protein
LLFEIEKEKRMSKKSKAKLPDREYFYQTPEGWFWCLVPGNVTKQQALSEHRHRQLNSGPFKSEQEMYDDHYDMTAFTMFGDVWRREREQDQEKHKKRKAA